MIHKALLAKIRKCLALASSSNEHEAAAALAKARELMEEHGVDDATLAMAEVEEATGRASRTQKPPMWETILAHTVARALDVTSFVNHVGDRTFVGRGARSEVAAYAFVVLFRQLKAARAAYIAKHLRRCRPGRKRARADAFSQGWAAIVHSKIAALYPVPAVDDVVGQYLAVHHPGLAPIQSRQASSRRTDGDFSRGVDAGADVNLHSGVGAAQSAPLMLA